MPSTPTRCRSSDGIRRHCRRQRRRRRRAVRRMRIRDWRVRSVRLRPTANGACCRPGRSHQRLRRARRPPIRPRSEAGVWPSDTSFGLIPVDEHHRRMGRQWLNLLIATPSPVAAVGFKPIDRPFGPRALAPRPPGGAPELTVAISAGTNESRELGIPTAPWRCGMARRPHGPISHCRR